MNHELTFKQPAAFFGQPWREATPLGNGKTGALVYGGVATEHILLNRYDLWHGAVLPPLPDVSAEFLQCRHHLMNGDYHAARDLVCNALHEQGYEPECGTPFPLGLLTIEMATKGVFKQYRRTLKMDTAECEVSYVEGDGVVKRRCFVSRADDVLAYEVSAAEEKEYRICFDLQDDHTEHTAKKKAALHGKYSIRYQGDCILFLSENEGKPYGACIRVLGGSAGGDAIFARGSKLLLLAKCFSGKDKLDENVMKTAMAALPTDYAALYSRHVPLHGTLYGSAALTLSTGQEQSADELLDACYEDEISPALLEKLWKLGRYLFICGTDEEGLPFPLYGLWHGEYAPQWAQYVCNENVQITYWHALSGNLSPLMKPLIRFFAERIPALQENAKRLFGCRGIYISTYSSPLSVLPAPVVPVIIHYIGAAGWLCQHFYRYYQMTRDEALFKTAILPLMLESAAFYEDYIQYDENGRVLICPSVSPENSPANFVSDQAAVNLSHPMPVTQNATMDVAIIKELFGNLCALAKQRPDLDLPVERWERIGRAMPDYMVNETGAIKEWMVDDLLDNDFHRHLSHVYPLFPGNEITADHPLREAFARAVDRRELGGQTGWSLSHTASIYAALGRGEAAKDCMTAMAKGCLMHNLMSLHNDYRSMGVTMELGNFAPMQLDANMGAVNAVQMMLLQYDEASLRLLPALPAALTCGEVRNFRFFGGMVSMRWDESHLEATILPDTDKAITLFLPERYSRRVTQNDMPTATPCSLLLTAGQSITLTAEVL